MTAHRNPPLPKGTPRSRKKAQTNPPKRRKKKRKTLIALTAIILLIGSYLYLCQQTSKYQVSDYRKKLPDGYTIHGLDISHHQGDINWEVLTQSQENQPPSGSYSSRPPKEATCSTLGSTPISPRPNKRIHLRSLPFLQPTDIARTPSRLFHPERNPLHRRPASCTRHRKERQQTLVYLPARNSHLASKSRKTLSDQTHHLHLLPFQGELPERQHIQYLSLLDSPLLRRTSQLPPPMALLATHRQRHHSGRTEPGRSKRFQRHREPVPRDDHTKREAHDLNGQTRTANKKNKNLQSPLCKTTILLYLCSPKSR